MDVRTLIAPVRDSYVRAFERAVLDFKLNRSKHYLLECSLGQIEETEAGMFPLPMRHDLLPLVDGRPDSIAVIREERPTQVPESVVEINGIPITIRQFTWDQFEIRAAGARHSADMSPVLDWFDRWFDRAGRRPEMAGGIRGVIHSLHGPFWTEDGMVIEVDLGTATADALVDLLYAVSHLAPTAIEVITPSPPRPTGEWHIPVPEGWVEADEAPDQPITYTRERSTFRVAVQEDAALDRNVDEAQLADAVRQLAMGCGARKSAYILNGTCPLGLYAAVEWRTLEHGTIRLWMLTNRKDVLTISLIGDDLTERDIRQITDCVMAIVPRL